MLALSAALLVFLACVVAFYAWRAGTMTEGQKRVQDQLRRISMIGRDSTVDPTILRDKRLSDITFIDRFLSQFPLSKDLELLLYQAGLNWRVGTLVLLMLLTGAVFFLLCVTILGRPLVGLLIGVVTAFIPYAWVRGQKTKRMNQFSEQLPDALDLMTSALRAGLSFPAALQLVAQESPEPLAQEFAVTFDEQNLGLEMKEALVNLTERVESLDLKFFVTAVIIQRETGGNLAEIMESIAHIIRERFRILGDVKSRTAHGRLTGMILSVLPIALALIFSVIAPQYMVTFFRDPAGQVLLIVCLVMQIVGYIWIRRVIAIKV
ncbi:MAG: type II secretion system F family protein [Candidatus Eiseniibacteriota bacterium]